MFGSEFDILWRHLWQLTLLIPVAVWSVRWTCRHRPHLAHAILLLCLLKCVFPPVWTSPTGLFCWLDRPPIPVPTAAAVVSETNSSAPLATGATMEENVPVLSAHNEHVAPAPATPETAQDAGASLPALPATAADDHKSVAESQVAVSAGEWGLLIWLVGVVAILGYLGGKRYQLLKFHEDTEVEPTDALLEIAEEVGAQLNLRRTPRLLVTVHPTIPFASGAFSPRVVLPDHLVINAASQDLRLIVAHEMTHLRRGDLVYGAFQLVVQSLLWFHPGVWWLNREIRRVREDCCDEEVLARLACAPKEYARCLLNVLELQQRLRSLPELAGLKPVEVTQARLQNIMRKQKTFAPALSRLGWVATLVLGLLVLPGGAIPYPATAQAAVASQLETLAVPQPVLPPVDPLANDQSLNPGQPAPVPPAPAPLEPTPPETRVAPTAQLQPGEPIVLQYGLQAGEALTYQVTISLDYPDRVQNWNGPLQIQVLAGDEQFMTVEPETFAVHESSWQKPNPQDPFGRRSLPYERTSPFDRAPSFPSRHGDFPGSLRREPTGIPHTMPGFPFASPAPAGLKLDRHGRPTRPIAVQPLPLLLGDLFELAFPRLPPEPFVQWAASGNILCTIPQEPQSDPYGMPSPPWQQEPAEQQGVDFEVAWSQQPVADGNLQLRRTWQAHTLQQVDGEPAYSLDLTGDLVWNSKRGCWDSIQMHGRATQRGPNIETRIPLSVQLQRQ